MSFPIPSGGVYVLSAGDRHSVAIGYSTTVSVAIEGRAGGAIYPFNLAANLWNVMTYGGGRFLALENSGVPTSCATSSDYGKTWTLATGDGLGNYTSFNKLIYNDGRFFAAPNTAVSYIQYSDNYGESWQASTTPVAAPFVSMAYGGGVIVAIKSGSTSAVRSTDNGDTWESISLGVAAAWTDISYIDGAFVIVTPGATSRSLFSLDGGLTWSNGGLFTNALRMRKLASGDNIIVCALTSSDNAYGGVSYSTDCGATWATPIATPYVPLGDIVFNNGAFLVATGSSIECLNEYLPTRWQNGGLAARYTPVATRDPLPSRLGAMIPQRRRITPKVSAIGSMAHMKVFGAPRGLLDTGSGLAQLQDSDVAAHHVEEPSNGLPLAVSATGEVIAVTDAGGVWHPGL